MFKSLCKCGKMFWKKVHKLADLLLHLNKLVFKENVSRVAAVLPQIKALNYFFQRGSASYFLQSCCWRLGQHHWRRSWTNIQHISILFLPALRRYFSLVIEFNPDSGAWSIHSDLFAHDLAIIEVDGPGIRFDEWTQPICLPPRDFTYQTGRKCVVSGWGSMGLGKLHCVTKMCPTFNRWPISAYPSRLQAAVLPIIDRAECMNSSRIYSSMSRSAFCAGYLHVSTN